MQPPASADWIGSPLLICNPMPALDADELFVREPPDVLLLALGVCKLAREVDEHHKGGGKHDPDAHNHGS